MTTGTDLDNTVWRKSNYSNGSGGDCVEVATPGGGLLVRDSKRPAGPVVPVRVDVWKAFLSGLRDGDVV
jgi:hypothetical protein